MIDVPGVRVRLNRLPVAFTERGAPLARVKMLSQTRLLMEPEAIVEPPLVDSNTLRSMSELSALAPALVMKIERLIRASEHKRHLPPVFEPSRGRQT